MAEWERIDNELGRAARGQDGAVREKQTPHLSHKEVLVPVEESAEYTAVTTQAMGSSPHRSAVVFHRSVPERFACDCQVNLGWSGAWAVRMEPEPVSTQAPPPPAHTHTHPTT